jgi:hypothetical protein
MEKPTRQEDVDSLDEEIDSTIDRLFVEKKEVLTEELPIEPFLVPSAVNTEVPANASDHNSPSEPAPESVPFSKSMEKLEAQLLSLEWDVATENLLRAKEEITALKNITNKDPQINSVLDKMDELLDLTMKNVENISPTQRKLLLDSMETIKLLSETETVPAVSIFKRLAYEGIEARFSRVEESKDTGARPPSVRPTLTEQTVTPPLEWTRMEEMLHHSNALCEKMGTALERIEQRLSVPDQGERKPPEQGLPPSPMLCNITVFQIHEKFFGVPSDKVIKLFKVPDHWQGHFQNQQKIRLKDLDVKIIDLKRILPFDEDGGRKEVRILIVKDNEEYKGLMVERVIKRFPAYPEIKDDCGEYFRGMICWNHQDHAVEVPILDLTRF